MSLYQNCCLNAKYFLVNSVTFISHTAYIFLAAYAAQPIWNSQKNSQSDIKLPMHPYASIFLTMPLYIEPLYMPHHGPGSTWLPMDPYGSLWLPMAPYRSLWLPMAPYGSLWLPLAHYGSPGLPMAPYGSLWLWMTPYGYIWLSSTPYCSLYPIMAPFGSL